MAHTPFTPALLETLAEANHHLSSTTPDTSDRPPIIRVLVLTLDKQLLDKAEHLIHRDLQSHLVTYHKAQHMLMAAFYTLDCFSPSECLGFYHYHLQRTLGAKALVWLSTEGGRV